MLIVLLLFSFSPPPNTENRSLTAFSSFLLFSPQLPYSGMWRIPTLLAILFGLSAASVRAAEWKYQVAEIERELGVGYAVTITDVNADGKPDIVVVDTERVLWYENPDWKRRVITEGTTVPDNVCIAAHDIDGDGKVDFALGAGWKGLNSEAQGTVQWLARGATLDEPWTVRHIAEEPSVHRLRWADLAGDGKPELVVLPLLGPGTTGPSFDQRTVRMLSFSIPDRPTEDRWPVQVLNDELHVAHNFWPTDFNGDGKLDLLVVSFEGVSLLERNDDGTWRRTLIGAGYQVEGAPSRGASEIKPGVLAGGEKYIATIEPWHGFQVVVYTRPAEGETLWQRHVIDEQLKWGHAVWCANLDGDGDEELIIGVRDQLDEANPAGVRIYDPTRDADGALTWSRQLVDPGGVAVEDLAASDLNGDGLVDIVAAGRQTKNVRIYTAVQ